ncbi:MAG: hypothetical protein ABIJ09_16430 [Pseudomonadota bacterium]
MLNQFPRIAHFQGSHADDGDLWLAREDEQHLLHVPVQVSEKLDGINVAIAHHRSGFEIDLRPPWNRSLGGAVARAVEIYVRQRATRFQTLLGPHDVAYGEWLWHCVSLRYQALPDVMVIHSLYRDGHWLFPQQLQSQVACVGLTPQVAQWQGVLGQLSALQRRVRPSAHGAPFIEGLVIERLGPGPGPRWGKWVHRRYRHIEPGVLKGDHNVLRRTGEG